MKEQYLFIKVSLSLSLFYCNERVGMAVCVCVCVRERETKGWTEVCYNLHSVRDGHSKPYFCLTFTHWLLSESDLIFVSTANLLSLYDILNGHTFFFQFSIHVTYFHCPLVYKGAISSFEIPYKSVRQKSLCNN